MKLAHTVSPTPIGGVRLDWTGTAGAVVRVYLNGVLTVGPVTMAGTAHSATISVGDSWFSTEVHETNLTESVVPAAIPLRRRPLVWWRTVAAAVEYRLSIAARLLRIIPAISGPSMQWRTADVRQDGGTWTTATVEAVASTGVSASSAAVSVLAPGAPSLPRSVTVTPAGGGTFTIGVGT